jgi:hypothetical protein
MRDDIHVERLRHSTDLHEFRDSAMADLGLHDAHGSCLAAATQQGRYRDAEPLAREVVERDVDARQSIEIVTSEKAAHPHQVVEVLVDHHSVGGVPPEDHWRQHIVNSGEALERYRVDGIAGAYLDTSRKDWFPIKPAY